MCLMMPTTRGVEETISFYLSFPPMPFFTFPWLICLVPLLLKTPFIYSLFSLFSLHPPSSQIFPILSLALT